MFSSLLLLALQQQEPVESSYQHVLLISVDGLRADALTSDRLADLPGFSTLLTGAHTLDARTDPDDTRTLPNHVGMLTGRTKLGDLGHGWETNVSPPNEKEVHDVRGERTAGVFEVLTAHGLIGGIFAAKEKFMLFPRSWDGSDAARATPAGMVDVLHYARDPEIQVEALLAFLASRTAKSERSFTLLHLAGPDKAGHADGWSADPESPYADSIREVDLALHTLLFYLADVKDRIGPVAIVLTTDHGGGVPVKNHHGYGRAHVNVTIPFLVWTSDGRAHGDLYALNPEHLAAPGLRDPRHDAPGLPPLRNLDAGNLCLDLLGLPAIPGSTVGAHQALRIAPPTVGNSDD